MASTPRGNAAQRPNGSAQGKICQFKLVLLGESAVGKSSLVLRFVKGQFHEFQESTIGAAFLTQTVCMEDTAVKFESKILIWVAMVFAMFLFRKFFFPMKIVFRLCFQWVFLNNFSNDFLYIYLSNSLGYGWSRKVSFKTILIF